MVSVRGGGFFSVFSKSRPLVVAFNWCLVTRQGLEGVDNFDCAHGFGNPAPSAARRTAALVTECETRYARAICPTDSQRALLSRIPVPLGKSGFSLTFCRRAREERVKDYLSLSLAVNKGEFLPGETAKMIR